jgi:hypothetical protein
MTTGKNNTGNNAGNSTANTAGNTTPNTAAATNGTSSASSIIPGKRGSFFAADLKRAFTEPTFFTALFLGILMCAGGYIYLSSTGEADFVTAQSLVFPFAAPFLAALPYAFMNKSERDINYAPLLKLRRGGRGYGFTRFLTVGIAGGAVILISEAVLAGIVAANGGFAADAGLAANGGFAPDAVNNAAASLPDSFEKLLTTLALAFPFGFAFAVLSHALCFFSRNVMIALITPQVLYLLLTYAFPYLDLEKYYPPLAVSPYIYGTPNLIYLSGFIGAVILTAAILTFIGETIFKANE